MIKRIISINNPAILSIKDNQLVIAQWETTNVIPFEDIWVIVLDHREITLRSSVFEMCDEHNVVLIHCNNSHIPVTLSLPLRGHVFVNNYLKDQLNSSIPTKKQLWSMIIQEKIQWQIQNLRNLWKEVIVYENLLSSMKSGDPENIEWQVASRYWRDLFGRDFTRERNTNGINGWLNYGYGILRASIARAVVAGWLHPSIGIWHDNQYNYFNLVDDLIEPFRPLVDDKILSLLSQYSPTDSLDTNIKQSILSLLTIDLEYNDRQENLMSLLTGYIASFRKWLQKSQNFKIPRVFLYLQKKR